MHGVDVANQLRSNYSCQVRIHKWWHRIFYFLLDMSVVNMYLMYLKCWKKFPIGTRPMVHLQFRNNLCKAMIQGFHGRAGLGVLDLPHEPCIHIHHGQNIVGNALCVERGATIFVSSVIASLCASHRVALRGGIPPVVEVFLLPLSRRILYTRSQNQFVLPI
jgi:hypothetical protein